MIDKARELREFSRAFLVEETGLSAATVSQVIRELIEEGLLTEIGAGRSRGGRPGTLIRFEGAAELAAVVETDGVGVDIHVAGWDGDVVAHRTAVLDVDPVGHIARLIGELGVEVAGRLRAVCVAVPGVASTTGELSLAPSLMSMRGKPLAELLQSATGLPVVVDNDVNLIMVGEHVAGVAEGVSDIALLHVGPTGIGAAFMLDGAVRTGAHGHAGEIGFLPLTAGAFQRDEVGDFERRWSADGLRAQARERGIATGDDEHPLVVLLDRSASDPEAARLYDEAVDSWARAIASVVCIVDPTLVLLSGELTAAGRPGIAPLQDRLRRYWPKEVVVDLVVGVDALRLGAARRAFAAVDAHR
ncbi:Putative NBD/HSP70 family sugar kinase [Stackebrandtia soli]